jgi:hypothetical protein
VIRHGREHRRRESTAVAGEAPPGGVSEHAGASTR